MHEAPITVNQAEGYRRTWFSPSHLELLSESYCHETLFRSRILYGRDWWFVWSWYI